MIRALLAQTMVIHDIAQGRQAGRIEIRVAQSRAQAYLDAKRGVANWSQAT
jgi:hypothetical protein